MMACCGVAGASDAAGRSRRGRARRCVQHRVHAAAAHCCHQRGRARGVRARGTRARPARQRCRVRLPSLTALHLGLLLASVLLGFSGLSNQSCIACRYHIW